MKHYKTTNRESGNVLFLILIAVALFAALSYAVTSSTNSGGGNANDESNLVNSAAVTQYPASIKTAMIRQQVSKGVATPAGLADLAATTGTGFLFNKPPTFSSIGAADEYRAIFHPNGGAASYVRSTDSVLTATGDGNWLFNMDFEVVNIGTNVAGVPGNDIIAFLPNITNAVCDRINEELGIPADPVIGTAITITDNLELGNTPLAGLNTIGTAASSHVQLAGEPYGCFENGTGTGVYVYYHVLLER